MAEIEDITLLRRFKDGLAILFGLLIAFWSVVVCAYSNPYFDSFNVLFFAGLLPYLFTLQLGFDQSKSTVGVAL